MSDERIEDFAHYKRKGTEPIPMWTIYASPSDFPGVPFVARKWEICVGSLRPTEEAILCGTLREARMACTAALGHRAIRIERNHDDDPVIVETWI